MSRIVFDYEPEGTPYDRDEDLTAWRLVGSATYPTRTTGARFLARTFDGTSGYEADDQAGALQGVAPIAWRILCRPDYDALAGTTVSLMARGRGGPTAGNYWPWDIQLAVNGGATQATVTLAWQDETGATVAHDLGTYDRPSPGSWTLLAVSREPVDSGTYIRLSIDGVAFPELTVSDQITATPAEVVTLGCRRNLSAYEQEFIGDIELAFVESEAATPLQERHAYQALLVLPLDDRETIRRYLVGLDEVIPMRGSVYDRTRIRPFSELLTTISEAVVTRTDAALPNTAYGPRLEQWETALALTDAATLSLAERQVRAAAAYAKLEGLSLGFQQTHASTVLETGDPLEVVVRLTRVTPDHLWLGTDTDLVEGTVLTPAGVAYTSDPVDDIALSCPWGRSGLALGIGLGNKWTLPDATVGNVTNTEPVAIVLGYTLRYFAASTFHLLAGNRETATLIGWEIFVTNTGQLSIVLDNGPTTATVTLAAPSVSLDTPHYVMLAFDGTTLTAATELASGTAAFALNPSSTTAAALGSYRATSPESTANWDCNLFAIFRGAKVAALAADAQGFCELLHAATENGA